MMWVLDKNRQKSTKIYTHVFKDLEKEIEYTIWAICGVWYKNVEKLKLGGEKMANEIRISASDMETRASQYENEANTVEEVIANMDRLLEALQDEWKGDGSEAYAARYEELKPSFVGMQGLIHEIAEALRSVSRSMVDEDSRIASQFSGN